jgi:hypothetical protein
VPVAFRASARERQPVVGPLVDVLQEEGERPYAGRHVVGDRLAAVVSRDVLHRPVSSTARQKSINRETDRDHGHVVTSSPSECPIRARAALA